MRGETWDEFKARVRRKELMRNFLINAILAAILASMLVWMLDRVLTGFGL